MRTKVLISLWGLFFVVMFSGCGGGSNGMSVTAPSFTEVKGFENVLAENSIKAKPQGPALFSDTFSDATFSDGWLSLIEGNYTIVQQGGALKIAGDASANPCDPDACQGVAGLETLTSADAAFPVSVQIDVDITGSVAVTGSSSGAVFALADTSSNEFRLSLAVAGAVNPFCTGICLSYSTTALPAPITLLQNLGPKARLKISYENGNFTIFFNGSQVATVSGPVFSGAVAGRIAGGTRYDPNLGINPSDIILRLSSDNASLEGTRSTPCDIVLSQQSVQNAVDSTQNLLSDMQANGVSAGIVPQLSVVLPKLNAALQSLQTGQYRDSLNQLRGTLGPLSEAQRGLEGPRGSNLPPNLVDDWINDIGAIRADINIIVGEAGVCS